MILPSSAYWIRSHAVGAEDRGIGAHLLEIGAGAREAPVLVSARLDVVRLPGRVARVAEHEHGSNYCPNISHSFPNVSA